MVEVRGPGVGWGLAASFIVYQMEFDKTKWSCPWNSDQNCTHNSARGWWGGVVGVKRVGGEGRFSFL